ncbi:MAG: Rrf2 family transcriptional regulator [Elusimicrobia bacterium]|nr:Rrf2 family transcriptional regulator [Elusimicrobiota bacterium]
MGKTLNLTKAGEYAIGAMCRLSLERETRRSPVSVAVLAEGQNLPVSFLAKIVAVLARAGLVRARRGPQGGVVLARHPSKITLLEIVEACEGVLARDFCVFYPSRPCDGPACEVFCPLRETEEKVRTHLEHVTLERMAESLRIHPNAARVRFTEDVDASVGRDR